MEENVQDESSMYSRYRSPTFRKVETNLLVKLVRKYKAILFKKSNTAATNLAKDKAWEKVTKEFNAHGLGIERSADVLRTKWHNLRNMANKLAKNISQEIEENYGDEFSRTVAILCSEGGYNFSDVPIQDDSNKTQDSTLKSWLSDDEDNNSSNSTNDETPCKTKRSVTLREFSPNDCKLLLKCVREEKNILFSKTSALFQQRAWRRVAESYNKSSSQKRSPKELSKKFNSMKNVAKQVNIKYFKSNKIKKYEHLQDDDKQRVKSEPMIDCVEGSCFGSDDDKVPVNAVTSNLDNNNRTSFTHDPLSNVQGSDSGLVLLSDNNRSVGQLNSELLQYKIETARLERKRIEEKMKGDAREREMKELEHSIRLRTARLELLAAESKLPSNHPGLRYNAEEERANEYLSNSQSGSGKLTLL